MEITEEQQIALDALRQFGRPIFTMFLSAMMQDARMLNQAADAVFLLMRGKMKDMPPELMAKMKSLRGFDRMVEYILYVAPAFIVAMPNEQLREGIEQIVPYCERVVKLTNEVQS